MSAPVARYAVRREDKETDLNIHTFMEPEQRNWDKQLMEQIIRHQRDQ